MIYIAIVILAVFMGACTQILLKKSAGIQYGSFIRQYLNVRVVSAYCVLTLCIAVNIFAMNHGVLLKEVSILESLSYFFVPMLSMVILKERLNVRKIIAIIVIMCGVVIFFMK
ncbi:MAG: hypothetical protein J6U24_08225 [Paludibacteraceae bacterium]|nr:hypothetical protein [Paludibacteraceae bacterium]